MAGDEPVCLWGAGALLGEGPVWLPEQGALYWVDIKAPAAHRLVPATGQKRSWPMPEDIGFLVPRARGGFVAGLRSGLVLTDLDNGAWEPLADPEPERPNNRFNDAKCDSVGRLWAGSMDDGETEPSGALYRIDPDRSWRAMDAGYVVTNGPAFSLDGATLYHTDTLARTIYAFDLAADGALSNKRPHIHIPDDQGYPDGMTVDAEGCLWVAHWGGWRLTRFTPAGRVERCIPLPVAQVTSCAFGDPDLDRLYVTSAAIGLTPRARARQPLAGGLFEIPVGIKGLPPHRFAG
jgi:sugar lactone lactonase YvrE